MSLRCLFAGLLLFAGLDTHAETLVCTEIQQLPYTISAPGAYCLNKSLSTNQVGGGGILVNASNVRLDCNHHQISNTLSDNEDVGIASGGRSGVAIENCRIKGFKDGIHFGVNSTDIDIRNNKVVNARTYGILVWGSRVRIVDNTVLDTKYVSAVRDYNQAIYVAPIAPGSYSWDVVVSGNRVLGISGTSSIQAIRLDRAITPVIRDNHVGGLSPKAGGHAYAIMTGGSLNPVISDNVLTSRSTFAVTGIASESSSLCTGNIVIGMMVHGLDSCGAQQGNAVK